MRGGGGYVVWCYRTRSARACDRRVFRRRGAASRHRRAACDVFVVDTACRNTDPSSCTLTREIATADFPTRFNASRLRVKNDMNRSGSRPGNNRTRILSGKPRRIEYNSFFILVPWNAPELWVRVYWLEKHSNRINFCCFPSVSFKFSSRSYALLTYNFFNENVHVKHLWNKLNFVANYYYFHAGNVSKFKTSAELTDWKFKLVA